MSSLDVKSTKLTLIVNRTTAAAITTRTAAQAALAEVWALPTMTPTGAQDVLEEMTATVALAAPEA
jgi:hypothetical protein